jgi:Pyruvate/2-oxoacid:ferredoxin oxidoreductase delta subunit
LTPKGKTSIMSDDIFRQLQQRLDHYSMGFPATDSGIEIKILRYLFSEDEAALFLGLTPILDTSGHIADSLGQPVEIVTARLEDMAEKGLLFRLIKGATVKYGAIPFVHGLFEFQVNDLQPELAAMVEQYFAEGFDQAMQTGADHFLRPIPVQKSIAVFHQVAAYEDAVAILESKPLIVVADCICRKSKGLIGQGCDKPLEACFMFGSMARYYLDRRLGREVSLEEAVAIMERCRAAGLVTQPASAQNPSGMCNCCGDCCGVLRALNKHPRPAEMVLSNHTLAVEEDACTGCTTCLERCQMSALRLNADETAEVDAGRCIGCGLCVTACPAAALELRPKPKEEIRIPPPSMGEQMMNLARKRGIL